MSVVKSLCASVQGDPVFMRRVNGGYLNYMGSDEPLERVQAAFGVEKFARLRDLKRKFDHDNVFRQNQNIPPAPWGA